MRKVRTGSTGFSGVIASDRFAPFGPSANRSGQIPPGPQYVPERLPASRAEEGCDLPWHVRDVPVVDEVVREGQREVQIPGSGVQLPRVHVEDEGRARAAI